MSELLLVNSFCKLFFFLFIYYDTRWAEIAYGIINKIRFDVTEELINVNLKKSAKSESNSGRKDSLPFSINFKYDEGSLSLRLFISNVVFLVLNQIA